MPQSKLISTMLRAGTLTQILNADADPVTFSIAPSAGQVMQINRMLLFVRDNAAFASSEDYGGGGALDPGISLGVYSTQDGVADQLSYLLTDVNHTIKTNADWGAYCYDLALVDWGTGDEMITARWTFAKSGKPVYLSGDKGESLAAVVAGTCSHLVDHHLLVQGHYISQ